MKSILAGTAIAVLLTASAFAQSSTAQSPTGPQPNSNTSAQGSTSNPNTQGNSQTVSNVAAAQKIKQDLQSAGFTDVKIMAESFVVQAKSKDGDPVLMTIGPHGMSVFEAVNTNSGTGSTGGSTTGSSTGSSTNSQSSNSGIQK